MKKALIIIFCVTVIVIAAIVMWKFLFPFLGVVIEKLSAGLTAIF